MESPRSYGIETERRLAALLDGAEAAQRLLYAHNAADRTALRRRCKRKLVVEPLPQLFARRSYWDSLKPPDRALNMMRGLHVQHPSWTFCGPSAALAHGLPVTWKYLNTTHVIVPGTRASKLAPSGIRFHRITRVPSPIDRNCKVDGLPLAPYWRTVFDCLVSMAEPDALAIADAALRRSGMRPLQLLRHLRAFRRGCPGKSHAMSVARLADPAAESGGESIARSLMLKLGFEAPILQVTVPDPTRRGHSFRVDCLWFRADGSFVFGELDGRQKSEDEEMTGGRSLAQVKHQERIRESRLTIYGARIVRFGYNDLNDERDFARLLDSFGVPRRRGAVEGCAHAASLGSELFVADGWHVVGSRFDHAEEQALQEEFSELKG